MPRGNMKYTSDSLSKLSANGLINIIMRIQNRMVNSPANLEHTRDKLMKWSKQLLIDEVLSLQKTPSLPKLFGNTGTLQMLKYLKQRNIEYCDFITSNYNDHEIQVNDLNETIKHYKSQYKQQHELMIQSEANWDLTFGNLNAKLETVQSQYDNLMLKHTESKSYINKLESLYDNEVNEQNGKNINIKDDTEWCLIDDCESSSEEV